MEKPLAPRQSTFRVIITLVVTLGFLIAVDFLSRRMPVLSPQAPGVELTDVSTIDDLYTRFGMAAGEPRLILFVSPT